MVLSGFMIVDVVLLKIHGSFLTLAEFSRSVTGASGGGWWASGGLVAYWGLWGF